MITYKCIHGHVFDESEMVRERVMEGEYPRDRFICPDCGTTDFEEAVPCEECGKWFRASELQFHLCERCREEIDDEIRAFSRTFKGARREYARCNWDESEGVFA